MRARNWRAVFALTFNECDRAIDERMLGPVADACGVRKLGASCGALESRCNARYTKDHSTTHRPLNRKVARYASTRTRRAIPETAIEFPQPVGARNSVTSLTCEFAGRASVRTGSVP